MARSTGPILAVGAITIANGVILNNQEMDWRIPVATGITAAVLALGERTWEEGAVAISWLALVGVLFVRLKPGVPAPVESFVTWINKK